MSRWPGCRRNSRSGPTSRLRNRGSAGSSYGPARDTGESELFFDIARGRVQRVTTALTQPMTMLSPAPNGGDVNTQMLIKSTLTLELVGAAGQ